jgi:hypothetical protein
MANTQSTGVLYKGPEKSQEVEKEATTCFLPFPHKASNGMFLFLLNFFFFLRSESYILLTVLVKSHFQYRPDHGFVSGVTT